jgi:hypothetical protein
MLADMLKLAIQAHPNYDDHDDMDHAAMKRYGEILAAYAVGNYPGTWNDVLRDDELSVNDKLLVADMLINGYQRRVQRAYDALVDGLGRE